MAWQSFNDQSGPQIEPRLTVRHDLGRRFTWTGFVGRFSQIPPAERYAQGTGNPALGVITAWQASTGLEGRWPSGLELDVTAYASRTEGQIVKDLAVEVLAQPPRGDGTPSAAESVLVSKYSAATGVAYGVETLVRARTRNGFFGWAALT